MSDFLQLCMIVYFITGMWLFLKVIFNFKKLTHKCVCVDKKETGRGYHVPEEDRPPMHVELDMPEIKTSVRAINLKSEEVKPTKRRKNNAEKN